VIGLPRICTGLYRRPIVLEICRTGYPLQIRDAIVALVEILVIDGIPWARARADK
jgi:hypothetical protein